MKHGTIIFTKVLAGLYQQGIFSEEKKNALSRAWMQAVKENDVQMLRDLAVELRTCVSNRMWKSELDSLIEEL